MNYNFEKDIEKRFRDQKGNLDRPFQEVCRLTRAEADEYYQSGQWYSIEGREYQCIRYQNSIEFIERDEKFVIFCDILWPPNVQVLFWEWQPFFRNTLR